MSVNSSHSRKIIATLCERGIDFTIFTLDEFPEKNFVENVKIYSCPFIGPFKRIFGKFSYLLYLPYLKYIYWRQSPTIVHSFYASSYGLLGTLLNPQKHFCSIWGDDVLYFPHKTLMHKIAIEFVLKKADKVFVTSSVLQDEVKKFKPREVVLIHYGVDLKKFKPHYYNQNNDKTIIGTVKALEPEYGIDVLIEVFAELVSKLPDQNIELVIYGAGSLLKELNTQVQTLNIKEKVTFKGKIPHDEVPVALHSIDIFAALSRRESFGVAILEAGACGKPVVASDVGGIGEIIENGQNGYLVNTKDEAFDKILHLLKNPELRKIMGKKGCTSALKFDWEENFNLWLSYH